MGVQKGQVQNRRQTATHIPFLSPLLPHSFCFFSSLPSHSTQPPILTKSNSKTLQENNKNIKNTMPESTSPTLPTNTLIITNLEVPHFEKETMLKLKAKAEFFGDIFYFAPIKSF